MDKNEQLDEEFRLGLASIRLFLDNLNSEDAKLCHSWLNKLYNSAHERILRNSLLKDLIENVKSGFLQHPFNKPPKQNPLSLIKTTDESEAVFPQKKNNRRRSEPFTLARWKEAPEVVKPDNGNTTEESCEETYSLLNTIATLKARNEALTHEVSLYQHTAETTQKELYNLNQEVISLRAKLSELQRINSDIERKHVDAITEHKQALTDSLLQVSERLKGVNDQNDVLLNNVTSLEFKLSDLNHQSEDSERKLKSEIGLLKSQLAKERKRHQAEILVFQNILRQKNEQLKKVDCHVKKQCSRMQEEVTNIKHEMDHVANENNSQLKTKISILKKDISKLERANKKLIAEYELRLQSCRKEYQLQVTRLTSTQNNNFENSSELEKSVINLEKKYRKLLSDLEKRTALQRKIDAQKIQQLEEELLKYKKIINNNNNGEVILPI